MTNILVRNVDDAVVARLKKMAKAAGKSVNDLAREALHAAAQPSKAEIWAEADRLRESIRRRVGHELSELDSRYSRRPRQRRAPSMTLVVDASVALKWVVPEAGSESAQALRAGDAHLIAPTLIMAEIGNVLWKKTMRREISRGEAVSALRLTLSHFAEFFPLDDLRETALELAIELRHPIYDCFYLALAQRERCVLVTADRRLLAAAEAVNGVEVRPLQPA